MDEFDEIYKRFEIEELNKSQSLEEARQQEKDGDLKFTLRLFYNFIEKSSK